MCALTKGGPFLPDGEPIPVNICQTEIPVFFDSPLRTGNGAHNLHQNTGRREQLGENTHLSGDRRKTCELLQGGNANTSQGEEKANEFPLQTTVSK